MGFVVVIEWCWEIEGIVVVDEFGVVDESVVVIIEEMVDEVVFEECGDGEWWDEEGDIRGCDCKYVEGGIGEIRYREE